MPAVTQTAIDRLIASLIGAYENAGNRIDAELKAIAEEEVHYRRRIRLRALATEIEVMKQKLDSDVQSWVNNELRVIYTLGASVTADGLGIGFSFTQAHDAAVKVLAQSTLKTMLSATKHMSSDVKRLVRASSKEVTLMKMLTGQTAIQAARELRGELTKNKIAAIVYKDGSRHGIADYADMNIRTVSANAYNQGTLIEGKQQGARYAIIYDGLDCGLSSHNGSPKANNLIVSMYQAGQNLISHPRCRRSFAPLPGIANRKEAKEAQDSGLYATSAGQDRAQRGADAVRQAQLNRLARIRARERREKVA